MNYYQISHSASEKIDSHPGLIYLQKLCLGSKKILDVGCGEGTRLNTLLPVGKTGTGVDPNQKAISQAKIQYPRLKFQVGFGEKLPYQDNIFDLVYSAFAIEHCDNPRQFIQEMVRVCQPGGLIVILAPNYGAPNRRSPNSVEDPVRKFINGLKADYVLNSDLPWTAVKPQKSYTHIDVDTTFEPYLYSLLKFSRILNLTVEFSSSLWSLEPKTLNPRKLLLSTIGALNLFPFKYWGPQMFAVFNK